MENNKVNEISTLRVYFGAEISNLYDVGYLSIDLYQLIVFSELIHEGDHVMIDKWFGENTRPLNRNAGRIKTYRRSSIIREAKNGSLELYVSIGALLTSIIVPLVQTYMQRTLGSRQVSFEVGVDDQNIQQALRAYANGTFGTGPQSLEMLFAALGQLGYSTRIQAQDIYVIDDVLNRYARRMVRTINKP